MIEQIDGACTNLTTGYLQVPKLMHPVVDSWNNWDVSNWNFSKNSKNIYFFQDKSPLDKKNQRFLADEMIKVRNLYSFNYLFTDERHGLSNYSHNSFNFDYWQKQYETDKFVNALLLFALDQHFNMKRYGTDVPYATIHGMRPEYFSRINNNRIERESYDALNNELNNIKQAFIEDSKRSPDFSKESEEISDLLLDGISSFHNLLCKKMTQNILHRMLDHNSWWVAGLYLKSELTNNMLTQLSKNDIGWALFPSETVPSFETPNVLP